MTIAVSRHARRRATERLCTVLTNQQWMDIARQIESGDAKRGPCHSSMMNCFEVDVAFECGHIKVWVVVEDGTIVTVLTPACDREEVVELSYFNKLARRFGQMSRRFENRNKQIGRLREALGLPLGEKSETILDAAIDALSERE